jgi:trigger factor
MKVEKTDLPKSQVELDVELSLEEFKPYAEKAVKKISKEIKIDGFRPGKTPYDILKQKIGDMSILEEAARIAINETLDKVIKENVIGDPVGQPKIDITKLAPENPFAYKVVLALIPEIKLGVYKDLDIKLKKSELDEKEYAKAMNDIREIRVAEAAVDRKIQDGDKVMIDIQMFLDEVPVEGGQGKDTVVIMGKDYIIPGFDKELLGAEKSNVKEFKLPYPKDHHMKNLAGKMVEFKVTIKDVFERRLPELNDDFAKAFGLKKLEDLEKNMREGILGEKKRQSKEAAEKEMLEEISAKTRFGDIPEMVIESETHSMIHELEHTVEHQGGKFEDYLKSINKTEDQLTLDILPDAVKRVKVSLLIREIAKVEDIKIDDKEIEKHIEDMKKYYQRSNTPDAAQIIERLEAPEYKNYAANVMASRKVIDKLAEWNVKEEK